MQLSLLFNLVPQIYPICTSLVWQCKSLCLSLLPPPPPPHPSGPATPDHLIGLVVRRPPRERKVPDSSSSSSSSSAFPSYISGVHHVWVRFLRMVPDSNPACAGIFSGSSHTSDLNIGTPVATLPGTWRYRVSAGTGRPGVSIL